MQLGLSSLESLTRLEDLLPASLLVLLAGGFSLPPCGHLHRAALDVTTGFPQSKQSQRDRDRDERSVSVYVT